MGDKMDRTNDKTTFLAMDIFGWYRQYYWETFTNIYVDAISIVAVKKDFISTWGHFKLL